jgi:hypothetical protein
MNMAIRKNMITNDGVTCLKAAMIMAFLTNLVWKQYCIMTMYILQNKTAYFALVLFGVQVDRKIYGGISIIRTGQELTLSRKSLCEAVE